MLRRPSGFWLFLAALAAACVGQSTGLRTPAQPVELFIAADDAPLRVMSFNIRYGSADDGDDSWPLRRDMVLRVIREFEPSVLGLQEALRFQLDEIGAAFPHFSELGVGRDDGRQAGEYSAILYDDRRLDVLDAGTFWLSNTPSRAGSTSWGNRIPRIVTWARFRDAAGDATFYVFNTHWDHESQNSRERSAELLLLRIASRAFPDPVLVLGDFNAGETNPAFVRLTSAADELALRDTYRDLYPEAENVGTFNGFTGETTGEKIDAVLISRDWEVLEADIIWVSRAGHYPSDHFPVTAVVRRR